MAEIGKFNTLTVLKKKDFGVYLDADELGEILLPRNSCPEDIEVGFPIRVFIYLDSEDQLIATTEKPYAIVGEFAMLKASAVNQTGAFMDWGLSKDVLLPFSEQRQRPVEAGRRYLVYIYVDQHTNRIVCSTKIDKFLDKTPPRYKTGDEVDLVIANRTDLGQKAIINGEHWGMLFKSDLLKTLYPGQRLTGYIKEVRVQLREPFKRWVVSSVGRAVDF